MSKLPTCNEIKKPLLVLLKRKGEVSLEEAIAHIAKHFKLSKAKQKAKQKCQKETLLQNRLRWARWEMQRDGMVETSRRGYFRLKTANVRGE
jgi:restriction system protein